ncbi:MAG: hypothetical protein H6721_14315 [Sandaracinus sp.]|nr:hypothetical protein [Sandaracinus sp.]
MARFSTLFRSLALCACTGVLASPAHADERTLTDLPSVHDACRRSETPGPRELLVLEVPAFRFGGYDREDGRLFVDTTRNLRALRGSVEILPAELEDVGFVASPTRARELRRRGRALRVGFFLGFDGEGQPCVVRSAVGVTLVRAELAFAELVDVEGAVVAREDTERLRAWLDDAEQDTIAGEGPRVEVGAVSVERGAAAAEAALRAPTLRESLGRCHARAVASGAPGDAMAVVRVRTDAAGRVVEKALALSDLADEGESRCVLDAMAAVPWPAGDRVWRVELRFAAD